MLGPFDRYIPKTEFAAFLFYRDPETGKYFLHALNDRLWPMWLYVGLWTDGENYWYGSRFIEQKRKLQKVDRDSVPESVQKKLIAKIREKII
jgi:hypothetical protein